MRAPRMKRPKQHSIDEAGERRLGDAFAPARWTVNPIEHDYGIDFDVQVFENEKPTGDWFKVQLKSSEETDYSSSGDFVSQDLDLSHARHYALEATEPTILIHVDIKTRGVFWTAPQLDVELREKLAVAKHQKTVTVRIPTKNKLPETIPEITRTLGELKLFLATRTVVDAPVPDFLASFKHHGDEEQVLKELREKLDAALLAGVQRLFLSGKYDEANRHIDEVLANPRSSTESKFWAALEKERVRYMVAARSRTAQGLLPQIRLDTSRELMALTKEGPAPLKFYALIAEKAAELEALSQQSVGLYMNYKLHMTQGNPSWVLRTLSERAFLEVLVWRKFNQCLRLARYAANYKYRAALPRALLRIVEGIAVFLIGPRDEKRDDLVESYVSSALQVCELACAIANSIGEDETISLSTTSAVMLARDVNAVPFEWARKTAQRIKDPKVRKETDERLERHAQRFRGEAVEGDIRHTKQQIYENMATAIGIDLADKSNPLTKLVYMGIQDHDPSHVVGHCEYIFVSLGPTSGLETYVSNRLGLPAGPKIVHCVLHDYAVQDSSLNQAFSIFKQKHCDTCPDRCPRSNDWTYSEEWQAKENERRLDFILRFWTKPRSPGKDLGS